MGLFDFFIKRKQERKAQKEYIKTLNGQTPIYSNFGDNIYASDVVEQAIYSIISEISKCRMQVVQQDFRNFDMYPLNNELNNILQQPNEYMTQSDFLEQVTGLLLKHYNAFIYKEYDKDGNLKALYPINPLQVSFLDIRNEAYIELLFESGYKQVIPYNSVIHIRSHFFSDDLMGGIDGSPNFAPILKVLKINDVLQQSISKNVQAGLAINGVIKYGSLLSEEEAKQAVKEFEEQLKNSESGILPLDLKGEYIPLNKNIQAVNEDVLKFIDSKILRYFGVSLAIVTGDYTPEQYRAFYQKTLEPIITKISQAMTKALCDKESKIILTPTELVFLSPEETRQVVNLLMQTGGIFENEKRYAFGLAPLEELKGIRMQSLNYVNVDYAAEYQLNYKRGNKNESKD